MKRLLGLLFALFVMMNVNLLSASAATTQLAWIATKYGAQEQINSGDKYYLKVAGNGYHLIYKERSFGINLGWNKDSSPNIQIEKSGGGKINCGDKVAIRVNKGGYLKYESRTWGINLVWSSTPVYQWEVRNEANQRDTPVKTDTKIALYNSVENDFMEYCVRRGNPVVDLGWAKDCADGWRAPGFTNQARDWIPYIDKAIKYGTALAAIL